MTKVIRGVGWTLIATGVVIILYLVYLLFYTNVETGQAQQQLLEEFEFEFGAIDEALPGETFESDEADAEAAPLDPGDAYAVIWFERPGSNQPIVHDEPLFMVEGVSLDVLRRGPGHYPDTADPGEDGNFSVSGHRTTYGAPFYNLDELQPGDEIHVIDRNRRKWVYSVIEQRVVAPTALWVVGPDPLGLNRPMITLTTCHPRFSASQRLIVFGELVDDTVAEQI